MRPDIFAPNMIHQLKTFLLLAALCCGALSAHAATTRIAGHVINGTKDGAPAVGVKIKLLRLNQSTGESEAVSERTSGADGSFDFGAVKVAADDMLFVRSTWQNQPYMAPAFDGANQLPLGIKVNPQQISAQVFDTSSSAPGLVFTAQHIAISSVPDSDKTLKCVERMVVENPTKTTFVGAGKEGVTIVLPLPKGAADVKLDPNLMKDAKLVKSGSVYGIAKPILPQLAGQRNAIVVEYTMPFTRGVVDLSRKLQYPARFFFVAREEKDKSLVIKAPKLGADMTQPLPIDGQTENRIVNSVGQPMSGTIALPAGTDIQISVERPIKPLVWGFVAFVAALLLAVPLTLLRSRFTGSRPAKMAEPARQASVNAGVPFAMPANYSRDQQVLIENLARLDDDYEAGRLDRDEYVRRRAEGKRELLDKMTASARPG